MPTKGKIVINDVRIIMRNYFSSHHLWGAKLFAEEAEKIETNFTGQSRFDIRHRSTVNASILSSVAFLESAINEVYKDAVDKHPSYLKDLDKPKIERLQQKWNEWHTERKKNISTLKKYLVAMECCEVTPLSKGRSPYQEANLVIKLRNSIVHFTPDNSCDDIPQQFDELQSKLLENQLMSGSGNAYFPDKCLGAGCSKWALTAVTTFANEFFTQIEVTPNYMLARF